MLLFFILLLSCRSNPKVEIEESVQENNDLDGDGFSLDEDCDDNDPAVHINATEICDGIDNDCDGELDEDVLITYYEDADGDGFGNPESTILACTPPSGYIQIANDCDDNDAEKYPGSSKLCDDLRSSFCAAGGKVSGSRFQGVFCLAPGDITAGSQASGSSFIWQPGPIHPIAP